jgi:hypothetical protein
MFLMMNKFGLKKLVGLLIYDDGRCRAYKSIRGEDQGCLYYSNDTFCVHYIAEVVSDILSDLGML